MIILSILGATITIATIAAVLFSVYELAIAADEESNIEALDGSEKKQDHSL